MWPVRKVTVSSESLKEELRNRDHGQREGTTLVAIVEVVDAVELHPR